MKPAYSSRDTACFCLGNKTRCLLWPRSNRTHTMLKVVVCTCNFSWQCRRHVGNMSATCWKVSKFGLTCDFLPTHQQIIVDTVVHTDTLEYIPPGVEKYCQYYKRLRNGLWRKPLFSHVVHALSYVYWLSSLSSQLSSPAKFYGICTYFDSLLKGGICTSPPQ